MPPTPNPITSIDGLDGVGGTGWTSNPLANPNTPAASRAAARIILPHNTLLPTRRTTSAEATRSALSAAFFFVTPSSVVITAPSSPSITQHVRPETPSNPQSRWELTERTGAGVCGKCWRYGAVGPVGAYRRDCSVTDGGGVVCPQSLGRAGRPGSGWRDQG
jgi:hypothetical protein